MTVDDSDDWEADWNDENEDLDTTIACPECGQDIYEDSERCPHCGYYVIESQTEKTTQPKWVVFTACALLVLFVYWLLRPWL